MHLLHRAKGALAQRAMANFKLERRIPVTHAGPHMSRQTGEIARELGVTIALVVTDKILVSLGVVDAAVDSLREAGIQVVIFDQVSPDPTLEQVKAGTTVFVENKCDGVIAIGGGSSIDCAKAIAVSGAHPSQPIETLVGNFKLKRRTAPLIAICTTHGTGSETTYAAVLSDSVKQRKLVMADIRIMPRVAILDPILVLNLPKGVSAATGMDALTHAVESFLSPWATPFSLGLSKGAVEKVMNNMLTAYHDGQNLDARMAMLQASFDAGVGIMIGMVGYVHAIAHALGGAYHIPHGEANAMVLPYILEAYGVAVEPQLCELAQACNVGNERDSQKKRARAFVARIREMQQEMGMPSSIANLKRKHIPGLTATALAEAHGEQFSMWSSPSQYLQDCGYPCPVYLSGHDISSIIAKLLPAEEKPVAKL